MNDPDGRAEGSADRRDVAATDAGGGAVPMPPVGAEALRRLARLAVPLLADWCAIHEPDEQGDLRPTEIVHQDPAKVELARRLQLEYPPDPTAPVGAYAVFRTGEPQLLADVPDEMLEAASRGAEHLELMRGLGLRSAMIVPLRSGRHTVGVITLVMAESGRRYQERDLGTAFDLAAQAAVAIENGRLYERARSELEQRRRAEMEAESARERLDLILRGLSDGVTVQDEDGRLIFVNPAAARISGFSSPEEMLGTPLADIMKRFDLLDEEGRPLDLSRLPGRRALRGERSPELVVRYKLHESGDEYWSLVKADAVTEPSGQRLAVNIFQDVTDRIRYEQALESSGAQLEELTSELESTIDELEAQRKEAVRAHAVAEAARAEAERANRAKTEFLAVMSHELRTPLNAVMGYVDLLQGSVAGPLTEMQARHLERIRASAMHLLGLINQILSLSRIEAGKEEPRIEPVDLIRLARDVANTIEPAAAGKGLALQMRLPDRPMPFPTDGGKLRQILLNLLSNAIKFTDAGFVELAVRLDGGALSCSVRDTGIGIAPADVDRIFEPFVQVDSSPTRQRGGTGLGLAVCRRFARMLGGDLTVASEPGSGSTFRLVLPPAADPGSVAARALTDGQPA